MERIIKKLEQKQNEILKNELIKKQIIKSDVFVCFITKRFVKSRYRYEQCKTAMDNNKIMYAAVKKGTRWRRYKKYPWKKIVYWETPEDIWDAMKTFRKDASKTEESLELKKYLEEWNKTSGGI